MSLRLLACLTLAMTVCVSSAFAQDESGRGQRGQGRGQGGPGGQQGGPGRGMGFGGGMGMGMMGGTPGASAVLGLLAMEEVRKEVGVSEEVYGKVNESLQEDRRKLFNRDLSEEDRKKIGDELNTKSQDMLDEILTPDKQKRLLGLYAQSTQARAVTNTLVAKAIGVSEEKRADIEKAIREQGESMRAQFQNGDGGRPDFTKIQEMMTKAQEDTNKLVDGKLTDAEKKALEELKGEKFEFPQRGFGGFGGGRGQGGPGAQGGPGGQGRGQGRPRGEGN